MPPEILLLSSTSRCLEEALEERYVVRRTTGSPVHESGTPVAHVRAVVTSGSRGITEDELASLPALELIAVFGVGLDKVPVEQAAQRKIGIASTPAALTDDVADMAVTLLLALARRTIVNDRYLRLGRWSSGEKPQLGRRVTELRVGILGLGRIGSAIAGRLEPFGCTIGYHNRRAISSSAYRYHSGPLELAQESDALIVSVAGGSESFKLVDRAVLDALGPSGFLVNVARGSVVDEEALIEALAEGRLGGAGLDVFEDEPNVAPGLTRIEDAVLQPHQGSATVEGRAAMAMSLLQHLEHHFAGGSP